MRTKKVLIIGVTLAGLVMLAGGGGYAYQTSRQQIDTITELNRACHKDKDADGYGNVTMAGGNFSNQKGTIQINCKIHLKPGSTFQMNNIQLETKDFVIFDVPKDEKTNQAKTPNHAVLSRVKLHGKDANFQINLGNPASTVVINDSTLDYAVSLAVGVGEGDDDTRASLIALRNKMKSTGKDTKGIFLVTTGKATFTDNTFELNDSIGEALLLGDSCEFRNNTNANDHCLSNQEIPE